MLQSGEKIARFLTDKDFDDFSNDALVHDAVVRNLEIISEASRHVGDQLKTQTPDIPWRKVADMGNWLRHVYDGVSDRTLWDTIVDELPGLLTAIRSILDRPDLE